MGLEHPDKDERRRGRKEVEEDKERKKTRQKRSQWRRGKQEQEEKSTVWFQYIFSIIPSFYLVFAILVRLAPAFGVDHPDNQKSWATLLLADCGDQALAIGYSSSCPAEAC